MITNLNNPVNWYVLYTYPNYEKKVDSLLRRYDITTFLPLQKVERKWSDRKKIVEVPLFPNYIFIQTEERGRFNILDTFGVKHYVTCSGRPVIVNNIEIDRIKKFLECPSVSLEKCLVKGDTVKIIEGPFEGLRGVLYEMMGKTRFCIRIESINQVLSIEVSSSCVEKINGATTKIIKSL